MSSLEAEVKVEELENKPIDASPPTAANYNLTFENMPLAYNILFYGQSFYQWIIYDFHLSIPNILK